MIKNAVALRMKKSSGLVVGLTDKDCQLNYQRLFGEKVDKPISRPPVGRKTRRAAGADFKLGEIAPVLSRGVWGGFFHVYLNHGAEVCPCFAWWLARGAAQIRRVITFGGGARLARRDFRPTVRPPVLPILVPAAADRPTLLWCTKRSMLPFVLHLENLGSAKAAASVMVRTRP
jgi:hypothetical protein